MITLVDERKEAPRTFRGVHPIKFRHVDDIIRQLSLAAVPASRLNPEASPFIPSQARTRANDTQLSVGTPREDVNEADDVIQEGIEDEDTTLPPEAVDVAAMIVSIGAEVTKISEEDLAKQHRAAKKLQFYYRRLQTRRANEIANPELGLIKTRKDRFEAFARAAHNIEWPEGSLYRPIYLGALPHLLVCLDYMWTTVMDDKTKVKRVSLLNGRHEEIEDLMKRRTKIKWVYNGVHVY